MVLGIWLNLWTLVGETVGGDGDDDGAMTGSSESVTGEEWALPVSLTIALTAAKVRRACHCAVEVVWRAL